MIKLTHKVIVWRFKSLVIASLALSIADSHLSQLVYDKSMAMELNPLLDWLMEQTGLSIAGVKFIMDAVFYSFLLWAVEHSRFVDVAIMVFVAFMQFLVVVSQAVALYMYDFYWIACHVR